MQEYHRNLSDKIKVLFFDLLMLIIYVIIANFFSKYLGIFKFMIWLPLVFLIYLIYNMVLFTFTAKYSFNSDGLIVKSGFNLIEKFKWEDVQEKKIERKNTKIICIDLYFKNSSQPLSLPNCIENYDDFAKEVLNNLQKFEKGDSTR